MSTGVIRFQNLLTTALIKCLRIFLKETQNLTLRTNIARRPDNRSNRLSPAGTTGRHPCNDPRDWPRFRPRVRPPVVVVVFIVVVAAAAVGFVVVPLLLLPPPAPLHGGEGAVVVALHAVQPLVRVEALHVGPHAVVEVGGEFLVAVVVIVLDELDAVQ